MTDRATQRKRVEDQVAKLAAIVGEVEVSTWEVGGMMVAVCQDAATAGDRTQLVLALDYAGETLFIAGSGEAAAVVTEVAKVVI